MRRNDTHASITRDVRLAQRVAEEEGARERARAEKERVAGELRAEFGGDDPSLPPLIIEMGDDFQWKAVR